MPDRLDIDPHALRRLAGGHDAAAARTRDWARQPTDWLKNFRASYGPIAAPVERAMVRSYGARERIGNAMADQHDRANGKPGRQRWQDAAYIHEQMVKHPVFADVPAVLTPEMNRVRVAVATGVVAAPDATIPFDRVSVVPIGPAPDSERPSVNSSRG
ncbi:ESX-1 secretion-associated protein [Nocardia sp. NBC_00881]|uniref:type VII secretion target n=1 Tax=Nocardia sp. NBC_00881 TaxID=2975995 RepID=UPI0038693624|nr:ESX-1 secretion-associated protein [Nocardia sp. NBC_00881]